MSFCNLRLRSPLPKDSSYPKELKSIGEHIRKRRMDLELSRRTVAERIGIARDTLKVWELGRQEIRSAYYPAIIEFLEYNPLAPGDTFAGRLEYWRKTLGMTQEELAEELGFSDFTFGLWESRKQVPKKSNLERMKKFFQERGLLIGIDKYCE